MIAVSHLDYTRAAGAAGEHLRGDGRLDRLRAAGRDRDPRVEPLDRVAVLPVPAIRARQGHCSASRSSAFVYEAGQAPVRLRPTVCAAQPSAWLPAGLVFLQPDLGTGIVLVAITLTILFVSGIPWQHFAALGAAIGLIAGGGLPGRGSAVGVQLLQGYQQDRLTSFLHPSDDPSDASYQVNQAMIAVGSGERSGRGDDATQTELLFLPERHTDFIFAVIGERFGFLGAAFVVFLYALLFWRAIAGDANSYELLRGDDRRRDRAMLAFQAIVNVGMNLGLMPVTGITLPLISYGGSSVLGTFLALGLLQAIHAQ